MMDDVAQALRVAARYQQLVAAGGYIVGPGGLVDPLKINVEPGCIYGLGASSSPQMVYVTHVDDKSITYKAYPFHGGDKKIERWIGEDLMAKGSKTLLHTRGELLSPELKQSLQSTLSGGRGVHIDPKQFEPVMVVVLPTVPGGKSRAEDPWYWAEQYGNVGGRETPAGYEYEIETNQKGLANIKKDHRFKIVRVEPSKRNYF
jgi:hypothetical protein